MDLFGDVLNKLTGDSDTGGGVQQLAASALALLNNQQGGISGLLQAFQQHGLGDVVSSWIGTGTNLPVSAEQIQQVLGGEQIQAVAQKAGIPPEAASSQLAGLLPGIVDRLTPNGEVPQGGDLMSAGMGLLQNFLSQGKAAS